MVLQAHGLCDQDLDILNGSVRRELDLGRELLDGLLGGYTWCQSLLIRSRSEEKYRERSTYTSGSASMS